MIDEASLDPDSAAEMTLLRAEVAMLRAGAGTQQQAALARKYRFLATSRRRLHSRSASRLPPAHVNKQRHRSLVLLLFAVVRIVLWTILAILIGCGLLGVGGFAWARTLAESLPFVVMISLYANWATDVDSATAAYAALVASDSHAAVVSTGVALGAELEALEADIARLAELQPGEEALALAGEIKRKLTA